MKEYIFEGFTDDTFGEWINKFYFKKHINAYIINENTKQKLKQRLDVWEKDKTKDVNNIAIKNAKSFLNIIKDFNIHLLHISPDYDGGIRITLDSDVGIHTILCGNNNEVFFIEKDKVRKENLFEYILRKKYME